MKIKYVLLSTNENESYWSCYETVKFAWERIIGFRCILVFTGLKIPSLLSKIETNIIHIPTPPSKSVFYSQNARLVVPAYLTTEEPIIISDIDMAPLSKRFFNHPTFEVGKDKIFTYRDCLIADQMQVAICYNAGTPWAWRKLLNQQLKETPSETLDALHSICGANDGIRGGSGWFFDQQYLFKRLSEARTGDLDWEVWRDRDSGFLRLDRSLGECEIRKLAHESTHQGKRMHPEFTDYHMLMPFTEYGDLNKSTINAIIGRDEIKK